MKKFRNFLCSIICFLVVVLCGCSAGGDCVNCFTNGCASFFECLACISNCFCTRTAVSCATCGVCGGLCSSDCGLYDCMTGFTCYECAEVCKSHISDFDAKYRIEEKNYRLNQAAITEVKLLSSITYDKGDADDYYKVSAKVSLTFSEGYTADNVYVVSQINTKGVNGTDNIITSTRWLGTVKGGKVYELTPEYYVGFSNKYRKEAYSTSNYNFSVTVYYGK